jgi:hypothetical protein
MSGAGGGPSGWHTPVVRPLNSPKQKQGHLQMSELVQGLPQATTACGVVPNWRMDKALADRTARNIAANNAFLSINRAPYFGGAGAGPSGWQTPVVLPFKQIPSWTALLFSAGLIVPLKAGIQAFFPTQFLSSGPFWNMVFFYC